MVLCGQPFYATLDCMKVTCFIQITEIPVLKFLGWCLCFCILQVNFFLLRRLLGVRTKGTEKQGKVSKLTRSEVLMLNIGSMSTGARVIAVKNDLAKLQLTTPVCTSKGEKVALSRRVEKHWRLIGWGQIQAGVVIDIPQAV